MPVTSKLFRLCWYFLMPLPGRLGSRPRCALLRRFGAIVAPGVTIGPGCRVLYPRGLRIGGEVGIARGVVLDARQGVVIGSRSLIGFESVLLSFTHERGDAGEKLSHTSFAGGCVVVGDDVWLGARCFLLPGTGVGHGSTVGACSVVTKTWGPEARLVGSPARQV